MDFSKLTSKQILDSINLCSSSRGYYLTAWASTLPYETSPHSFSDLLGSVGSLVDKVKHEIPQEREDYPPGTLFLTLDVDSTKAILYWSMKWEHIGYGPGEDHRGVSLYEHLGVPLVPSIYKIMMEILLHDKPDVAKRMITLLKRDGLEATPEIGLHSVWQLKDNPNAALYTVVDIKEEISLRTDAGGHLKRKPNVLVKSYRKTADAAPVRVYEKGMVLHIGKEVCEVLEVFDGKVKLKREGEHFTFWRQKYILDRSWDLAPKGFIIDTVIPTPKHKYVIGTTLSPYVNPDLVYRVIELDDKDNVKIALSEAELWKTSIMLDKHWEIIEHPQSELSKHGIYKDGQLIGHKERSPKTPIFLAMREDKPKSNQNEKTTMTMQSTATKVLTKNKSAAINTAKIGVGQAANKAAIKLVKGKAPMMVRGYLDTSFGKLIVANLANFAATQYAGDNEKVMVVVDAMVQAAMLDVLNDFDIDTLVEEFIDAVPAGKMNKLTNLMKKEEEEEE